MRRIVLLTVAALSAFLAVAAWGSDLDGLVRERTARVFVEGQALGDMVLNARARVDFVYVDRNLSEALAKDPARSPEQLRIEAQYFGGDRSRGKALFVLLLSTSKPWTVTPELFRIGDYVLRSSDILTPPEMTPLGELPSDFSAALAVAVPRDVVKPGSTIEIAVSGDRVSFAVPRR
jgi:hypothetical protein